jgi:glutamyl-tRNA synthetase
MKELCDKFELEHVNKAGAVFGREKLEWMNSEYIRRKSPEELLVLVRPLASERGYNVSDDYLVKVIKLMQERARTILDFVDFSVYFFAAPTDYEEKSRAKNWTPEAKERLTELALQFEALPSWDHASIEGVVRAYSESKAISAGKLIHPLRLAISGVGMGPGLFEMLEVIGKDEVISRIRKALEVLA